MNRQATRFLLLALAVPAGLSFRLSPHRAPPDAQANAKVSEPKITAMFINGAHAAAGRAVNPDRILVKISGEGFDDGKMSCQLMISKSGEQALGKRRRVTPEHAEFLFSVGGEGVERWENQQASLVVEQDSFVGRHNFPMGFKNTGDMFASTSFAANSEARRKDRPLRQTDLIDVELPVLDARPGLTKGEFSLLRHGWTTLQFDEKVFERFRTLYEQKQHLLMKAVENDEAKGSPSVVQLDCLQGGFWMDEYYGGKYEYCDAEDGINDFHGWWPTKSYSVTREMWAWMVWDDDLRGKVGIRQKNGNIGTRETFNWHGKSRGTKMSEAEKTHRNNARKHYAQKLTTSPGSTKKDALRSGIPYMDLRSGQLVPPIEEWDATDGHPERNAQHVASALRAVLLTQEAAVAQWWLEVVKRRLKELPLEQKDITVVATSVHLRDSSRQLTTPLGGLAHTDSTDTAAWMDSKTSDSKDYLHNGWKRHFDDKVHTSEKPQMIVKVWTPFNQGFEDTPLAMVDMQTLSPGQAVPAQFTNGSRSQTTLTHGNEVWYYPGAQKQGEGLVFLLGNHACNCLQKTLEGTFHSAIRQSREQQPFLKPRQTLEVELGIWHKGIPKARSNDLLKMMSNACFCSRT